MTITEIPDPNDQQPTPPSATEFDDFAATMPETAQGFLDATLPPEPTNSVEDGLTGGDGFLDASSGEPVTPARKRVNVTKKMRKAMNRLKTRVANIPIMWFHTQAKQNPEWELDAEEQAMMTDAIETVFDVLDIEVEIEPLSWTLTSVWWVVSYPLLAFVFLFLTKKSVIMDKEKDETL